MDVLLSDSHDTVGLCQAAGRLVNALVAVYGPELVPGSTVFYRCKVREAATHIWSVGSCYMANWFWLNYLLLLQGEKELTR